MSPIVKRVLTAVAVKKAYDYVQERRRPQRSAVSRFATPFLALAAAGGAVAFLGRTGRLNPLVDQAKNLAGRSSSGSESATEVQVSQDGPVPSNTTV
jgi:hypothetical protein